MIRFLVRLVAVVLLAGGFAAAIIDGTRSIAANDLMMTSTGDLARTLLPNAFARLQPAAERISPLAWNPVLINVLIVPACLMLALLGLVLLWLVRRPAPKIGYSSRP
jgi:hypothetical protein